MKLLIEADGPTVDPFEIEVENSDTVLQVKEKIHNSRGIPICDQTLFFDGNILHDDDATVEASGVEDQSLIRFVVHVTDEDTAALPKKKMKTEAASSSSTHIRFQIKLPPPSSDIVKLIVNADETVRGLKHRISELFEAVKTASESSGRRLVLRNEEGIDLPDDETLSDCQISLKSVVTVEIPPKMRLCLKILESDVFLCVYLRGKDTILQLKEIIHESVKVPVDRILVKDDEGNELPDDRTLTACGIMPDSELAVEYKLPAVTREFVVGLGIGVAVGVCVGVFAAVASAASGRVAR